MQELPAHIGKYRILGLAGKGAMGAVYIAHDPVVDRKVAIKVATISEDQFGGNLQTVRRLVFNEAQAAGALDHPHILTIYDAGDADGRFFIAMEYVEGARTVRDYTNPDRLAPVETVLKIVGQCADALDYAHRRGVTHRDIKPANIMLTMAGQVKICDFGIAQRTQTEATQVMGLLGSPVYMSPEQARDTTVTPQSDLFSLGVVLYELLTGSRPFAAGTIAGVLHDILHKDPEPVTGLRPELPKRLDAILKRALAKETSTRYGCGAEMAAELAHVLDDVGRSEPALTAEEKLSALRSLECFQKFSEQEVREVLKAGTWEHYRHRACIVEEGTPAECFYILVSGEVLVQRADKELNSLGEGECFGEMAYLSGKRRFASIIAAREVTVLKVTGDLRRWASLPLQMRLMRLFQDTLIQRLAHTSKRLSQALP